VDTFGFPDPALLVLFGAVFATIWFIAAARRRGASSPLIAVAAIGFLVGALIAALGATHSLTVIGVALRRSPFEYDFRLYSLVMLGVLLVTGGLRCLALAWKLTQGDARAWRSSLEATTMLLVVNVPLMPIQGFAVGFTVFLSVNLLGLLLVRRSLFVASQTAKTTAGALDVT